MSRDRYTIGYELDDNLEIYQVPRIHTHMNRVGNKDWKHWRKVFTHHRYVTNYTTNSNDSIWRHDCLNEY